eukprot:1181046-Prorocentrum_minimum.AAC.1
MHALLATRMFSLDKCPVSPDQKKNLFASVAELFEQGCSAFEAELAQLAAPGQVTAEQSRRGPGTEMCNASRALCVGQRKDNNSASASPPCVGIFVCGDRCVWGSLGRAFQATRDCISALCLVRGAVNNALSRFATHVESLGILRREPPAPPGDDGWVARRCHPTAA